MFIFHFDVLFSIPNIRDISRFGLLLKRRTYFMYLCAETTYKVERIKGMNSNYIHVSMYKVKF